MLMIIAIYIVIGILCQFSQKLVKVIIRKRELLRFIIFMLHVMFMLHNVQQYMCALQRKFVMLHIGPNLIILYLSLKKIYIDKIYALYNSQFLKM